MAATKAGPGTLLFWAGKAAGFGYNWNNMKISAIPKSGRKGSVVYLNTRHGKVARQYVRPRNPRTSEQQSHRQNFGAV